MRVLIVTPAPSGSTKGNRITAERWLGFLRSGGHDVQISNQFVDGDFDCLITLHATRSYDVIQRFRSRCPQSPVVLCLTGTDVHLDLNGLRGEPANQKALASIKQSSRIVLLEPESAKILPEASASKISVIFQSAKSLSSKPTPKSDVFEVCVVGHLREVKDPFLTSQASRLLPADSRIVVSHIGQALDAEMKRLAEEEMSRNPRYQWVGELTHEQTQHCIARARLMVLSSKAEGAPSVISEAAVHGTPILATRIAATVGLLGSGYSGLFPVGDVHQLSILMARAENDSDFCTELTNETIAVAKKFSPELERKALEKLMVIVGR